MILMNVIFAVAVIMLSERTLACVMGVECENGVGVVVWGQGGGISPAVQAVTTASTTSQLKINSSKLFTL